MNLPTRSFTDIIRDMSAAVTASAGRLVDMSVGSVLRAIIEANAAIVLWVQWLVLLTLQTTRAATSTGADLDSWMADFSLARLPAVAASGTATFSRLSGIATAFVAAGTNVKTQDASVSFAVIADPANPAWQSSLNAYCLPSGVMSLDLPIVALTPGQSGNVLSNTVAILASPVAGIDIINNATPTSGGQDPESDAAFRTRFAHFFASRSRATRDAVDYAISLVGAHLNHVIVENTDAAGNFLPGNMLIVVDDGTGSLTDTVLDSLTVAIHAVRPLGTSFSIQPPQILPVQVSLSVQLPVELLASATQLLLQSAIADLYYQSPNW
jgi:phage-related baseplate assembly protein